MITETNSKATITPDFELGTPIVDYIGPAAIVPLPAGSDDPSPAREGSKGDLALRRAKWVGLALIVSQIVVVVANVQSGLFTFWSVLFLLSPAVLWVMVAIKLRLDSPNASSGPITRLSVFPFLIPAIPWLGGTHLTGQARWHTQWRIITAIFAMQMLVPLSSLLSRFKADSPAFAFNLQNLFSLTVFYLIVGLGMMLLAMAAVTKSLHSSRTFAGWLMIAIMALSASVQSSYVLGSAFNTLSNLGLLLTLMSALVLLMLYSWPVLGSSEPESHG